MIVTERLLLRLPEPRDHPALFAIWAERRAELAMEPHEDVSGRILEHAASQLAKLRRARREQLDAVGDVIAFLAKIIQQPGPIVHNGSYRGFRRRSIAAP